MADNKPQTLVPVSLFSPKEYGGATPDGKVGYAVAIRGGDGEEINPNKIYVKDGDHIAVFSLDGEDRRAMSTLAENGVYEIRVNRKGNNAAYRVFFFPLKGGKQEVESRQLNLLTAFKKVEGANFTALDPSGLLLNVASGLRENLIGAIDLSVRRSQAKGSTEGYSLGPVVKEPQLANRAGHRPVAKPAAYKPVKPAAPKASQSPAKKIWHRFFKRRPAPVTGKKADGNVKEAVVAVPDDQLDMKVNGNTLVEAVR